MNWRHQSKSINYYWNCTWKIYSTPKHTNPAGRMPWGTWVIAKLALSTPKGKSTLSLIKGEENPKTHSNKQGTHRQAQTAERRVNPQDKQAKIEPFEIWVFEISDAECWGGEHKKVAVACLQTNRHVQGDSGEPEIERDLDWLNGQVSISLFRINQL